MTGHQPAFSAIAAAKINLALHVRARRPDGYHALETVFVFAEDGDVMTVAPGESGRLTIACSGPFGNAVPPGEADNLALRAARAVCDRYGLDGGLHFTLDKRLPVASGIGGGSADAAAAIELTVALLGIEATTGDLMAIAASIGSDVPACLFRHPSRGEGRGEALVPFDLGGLAGMPVLLVNPGVALSTGPVFKVWDGVDRGPLGDPLAGRNDLEAPARMLVPEIGAVLGALGDARLARMSGSGATCFGLYDSLEARDAAAARIAAAESGWWVMASRLRA